MTRVCFVTRDFIGPVRNGGIGTAFTSLVRLLVQEGHAVTVLYTPGEVTEDKSFEHWAQAYAKENIALVKLPAYEGIRFRNSDIVRQAYCAYLWLKEHDGAFDIVHFHDWHGLGAYAGLARKQGLAFRDTRLCIQLHAQALWHVAHNGNLLDRYELLESDAIEKTAIEHADIITSPSRYMLEWTKQRGITLPEQVQVIQNVMPEMITSGKGGSPVSEIVFFGRLEGRKGLDIFCEAIRRLPEAIRKPVTFLGKEGAIEGVPARDYIAGKLEGIVEFQILPTFASDVAQDYLKGEGRLAVIASRVENSPYTVLECLANGIAFLASDVGGTAELIAEKDRARVLFKPEAPSLAQKLEAALAADTAPARLAVSPEDTRAAWKKFHAKLPAVKKGGEAATPRISVCIAHRNRPELLRRALDSVVAQDYTNYEVVLVDDGSDQPEALHTIAGLEKDFAARGWTIIRQQNRYAGAARNAAAKAAKGEWLLFMDDDNIAVRTELSTFARATQSGADIYSCVMEFLPEEKDSAIRNLFVPLGEGVAAGIVENSFGDVNALVRRKAFLKLGGFTEVFGIGLEDMEFFAKAALAGYRIETVPEPLFRYRANTDGVQQSSARGLALQRALTPYLEKFPEIAPALMLLQGYHRKLPVMHQNYAGLEAGFQEMKQSARELRIAKDALDARVRELEQELDQMKRALEGMGEEAVRTIGRLRARKITRLLLDAQIRILGGLGEIVRRFTK